MGHFPIKLSAKLDKRKRENSLRTLLVKSDVVDFSSNDYLGFSKENSIIELTNQILEKKNLMELGATGSRLLTGNHKLFGLAEDFLADYHSCEAALIFNSGYDANLGFFSSVPQRNDVIFYDELCHASIRDGIQLGHARGMKFKHNSIDDLKTKLIAHRGQPGSEESEVYVVTESVFSMDGDIPELKELAGICEEHNAHLIVDEAHAFGVFGKGLIFELNLINKVFARVITFGKALGCHGAAILGSESLKDYLTNFSRSLIYTTALPPHSVASILAASQFMDSEKGQKCQEDLQFNIAYFRSKVIELKLDQLFLPSNSAIQIALVGNNDKVKEMSIQLMEQGLDVRPILAPTVPLGAERLRICIHAYNNKSEMDALVKTLNRTYSGERLDNIGQF